MRNYTPFNVYDAPQSAVAFMVNQAAFIERTVYSRKYPAIRYPELVPIDTSAPPWTKIVTYYSTDAVGKAEWWHGASKDVPHADVTREQFNTAVRMGAIGYSYDMEEIGNATAAGINLTADKGIAARRVSEEFIDDVVLLGNTSVGFKGLINHDGVTAGDVADGAGAADTTWPTKTPDEILLDVNTGLTGIYTGSKTVEMADTILLPPDRMTFISTKRLNDLSQTTIIEWLKANNVYTQETGRPLMIRSVRGLETAGVGGTHRAVLYLRDPEVVKFHMPMPYRLWPVWQTGPLLFEVPGTFRLGGIDVKRPAAFRYLDNI